MRWHFELKWQAVSYSCCSPYTYAIESYCVWTGPKAQSIEFILVCVARVSVRPCVCVSNAIAWRILSRPVCMCIGGSCLQSKQPNVVVDICARKTAVAIAVYALYDLFFFCYLKLSLSIARLASIMMLPYYISFPSNSTEKKKLSIEGNFYTNTMFTMKHFVSTRTKKFVWRSRTSYSLRAITHTYFIRFKWKSK